MSTNLLTLVSYRVVQFIDADPDRDGIPLFAAIAWNYSRAVLISTSPHRSYTGARQELDKLAAERGCSLRWFDGAYICDPSKGDEMWKDEQQSHYAELKETHYAELEEISGDSFSLLKPSPTWETDRK